VYVTCRKKDWPLFQEATGEFVDYGSVEDPMSCASMLDLTEEEATSLEIVELHCDYRRETGQNKKAPVYNVKKVSVIRADWKKRPIRENCPTVRAKAAYDWLFRFNPTYTAYVEKHKNKLREAAENPGFKFYIPTAELLLNSDGIEVAARPILYPRQAYGDSDLRMRFEGRLKDAQRPSAKGSYLRKCMSQCAAYATDFMLLFLISDVATARQTMSKISTAENRGLTPDVLADNKQNSESYWLHEQDILCDVVRQMALRCQDRENHRELWEFCHDPLAREPRSLAYPNVFITVAPGEWIFPIHNPLFHRWKHPMGFDNPRDLSHVVGPLTLHIYNVLMTVMRSLFQENEFFERVYEYVIRVEFQGRGTLHIHIAMWAILRSATIAGTSGKPHHSDLIKLLESYKAMASRLWMCKLGMGT